MAAAEGLVVLLIAAGPRRSCLKAEEPRRPRVHGPTDRLRQKKKVIEKFSFFLSAPFVFRPRNYTPRETGTMAKIKKKGTICCSPLH
jgi:hypothetical protein